MEIVKQDGNMDCGISCLLSVIRHFGGNVPIEYLREKTNTTKEGVSAYKLVEAAKDLGFESYGLKGNVEEIKNEYLPLIAHIKTTKIKHFVVIYKIDFKTKELLIMDPDQGKKKLKFSEFNMITSFNYIYLKPISKIPNIIVKRCVKRWLKIFSKKKRVYLFYIICFSLISFILNILTSFHFSFLLNNGINYSIKSNIYTITKVFLVIYLLRFIISYLKDKTSIKFSLLLDEYITKKYYKKLVLLPYSYYKNRTTGEIISRLEDLNIIKDFITNIVINVPLDITVVLVFMVLLFNNNKKIFVLLMIFNMLVFTTQIISTKLLKSKITYNRVMQDRVNTSFLDGLNKENTIKNLHIENKIINKFYKVYEKYLDTTYGITNISLLTSNINNLLTDIFYILFFFILSIKVIDNKLSIGMIIILENIIKYFSSSFLRLIYLYKDLYKYNISKKRIEELFMIREEKFDCIEYFKNKLTGTIKYNNLTYSFNNRKLLDGITLSIRPKDKIFFYGNSGSGKSTLMKMLLRYVDVDYGMISINGIDINHHHLEVIRNEISYVSQNESLFKDSIKNNITLGKDVSYEMLEKVSSIVCLEEVITTRENGINYIIDENNNNLSGGERQRIILARSLLKNSSIYIFDEALSQIDAEKEKIILNNIFKYLKDKIVIVISHRMTNKDLYNRIIKLEEGKIYEEL